MPPYTLAASVERQLLLREWNDSAADRDSRCLHEVLADRARRWPDGIAACGAGMALSYGELERRANQLARHLAAMGVMPEVTVGLCLERSPELAVGWLGILKAGGTCLPLDPGYPMERLAFMLRDAAAAVVVTAESLAGRLPGTGAAIVRLDADRRAIGRRGAGPASGAAGGTPDNLAYVIYTSGSSGSPKGAAIPHGALLNFAVDMAARFGLRPDDRVLQFASIAFDVSLEELFPAWHAGAAVVFEREDLLASPWELAGIVERHRVTVLELPSAYWNLWVGELAARGGSLPSCLRLVVVGGEAPAAEKLARWQVLGVPLINAFGLTEATVTSAIYRLDPAAGPWPPSRELPIGRPVANTRLHLLDAAGRQVPVGTTGELCIAGAGLARGYLNSAGPTAERFVPDPWSAAGGARLYRSGDLARYRTDGTIEFLGRLDQQVKVRGFRIEPGEIGIALARHPGVREALVVAGEDAGGERRLVAYVAVDGAGEGMAEELRRFLSRELPEHMVPSAFVFLAALPRLPSGKVDRRRLPAPDRANLGLSTPFRPPLGPEERGLAEIWAAVLGVAAVGLDDSLFDLGGHSLAATQVLARVRETFGVQLSLGQIFAAPTLAAVAAEVAAAAQGPAGELAGGQPPAGGGELVPVERRPGVEIPVSCSQERIWYLGRLAPGSRAYHTQCAYRFRGSLAVPVLAACLAEMVRRHEIYRTTFPAVGGAPVQRVHATGPAPLPVVDLAALPAARREPTAMGLLTNALQRPFDVERLPLLRWALMRLTASHHLLALIEHHLVHDGWSANLLTEEIFALYRAFAAGRPSPLAPLPVQFADFAWWQRAWLASPEAAAQAAFWRRTLTGSPPLALPADRPRPAEPSFRGQAPSFELDSGLTGELRALSRRQGTTLFVTVMAAFHTLLHRYTGRLDVAVGSGVANRRQQASERLIGMIVNNVVLRSDLAGDPSFGALLGRVMAVAAAAFAHQDLPFDKVVEAVRPPRDRSHNPLFQVLLSFHDSPSPALDLPGLAAEVLELVGNGSAKFDLNVILIPRADQARGRQPAPRQDAIAGIWEHSSDLFDPPTIARMIGHFSNLLDGAAATPERRLSELPLLAAGELHQLVAEGGDGVSRRPTGCLHEGFARQAALTPRAVAAVDASGAWTYGELDRLANHLAHRLRALGVGPEVVAAICLERSRALVLAVLAVLKAGGAYLALEPGQPDERLALLLADAAPVVVLTAAPLAHRFGSGGAAGGTTVLCLDAAAMELAAGGEPLAAPASGAQPDNLAYVVYTSGSTGRPKGVLVTHANVVRLFDATRRHYGFGPADVWPLFHSYAFDVSVWEIWGALLHGGRLVVVPDATCRSSFEYLRLLRASGATILNQTPSAFRQLARAVATAPAAERRELALRWVIFAGEALDFSLLAPWFSCLGESAPAVANMYGITETTVHSTFRRVDAAETGRPTSAIGGPLADLTLLLLDARGQPVPFGVPGEIHVGGAGLARGYLGRPDLTAERFVPDPFGDRPGGRLYRSADLARRRPGGDLDYLGRIDQQVKVRGYRIEPAEIVAALAFHPGVRDSAVVARPDA